MDVSETVRETRWRWFGHVRRRESEDIGREKHKMELPGRRQRGRPWRRFMHVVREEVQIVGVRDEGGGRGQGEMEEDDGLVKLREEQAFKSTSK